MAAPPRFPKPDTSHRRARPVAEVDETRTAKPPPPPSSPRHLPPMPAEHGGAPVRPSRWPTLTGKPGVAVALLMASGGAGVGLSQIVTSCTSGAAEMITAAKQPDAARELKALREEIEDEKAGRAAAVAEAKAFAAAAKVSLEAAESVVSDASKRVERGRTEDRKEIARLWETIFYHAAGLCRLNGGRGFHESMERHCGFATWEATPAEGPDPSRLHRSSTPHPDR